MTRRAAVPGVVSIGVTITALLFASPPSRDDPAKRTLLSMLVAADVIESDADATSGALDATTGLIPLENVSQRSRHCDGRFKVRKDAWGRDLLYWSDGWNYMLLSLGSDGSPDVDYASSTPPYWAALVGLTTDPSQDIVVVNGTIQRGPLAARQAVPNTTNSLRSISTACEEYSIDNNYYPNSGTALSPVSEIERYLSPLYIRNLPKTDGWGSPILYWTDFPGRPFASNYAVIGVGADGVPDHPYETWTVDDFTRNAEEVVTDLRRDSILVDGLIIQSPQFYPSPVDSIRRTMADLRSIGTACEEYSIDNNFYPGPDGGVIPVSALSSVLSPTYIRTIPPRDPWGQPLLYWSDHYHYWIISAAADRTLDHPYSTWRTEEDFLGYTGGAVHTLQEDIIFSNGVFVQYPQGIQT